MSRIGCLNPAETLFNRSDWRRPFYKNVLEEFVPFCLAFHYKQFLFFLLTKVLLLAISVGRTPPNHPPTQAADLWPFLGLPSIRLGTDARFHKVLGWEGLSHLWLFGWTQAQGLWSLSCSRRTDHASQSPLPTRLWAPEGRVGPFSPFISPYPARALSRAFSVQCSNLKLILRAEVWKKLRWYNGLCPQYAVSMTLVFTGWWAGSTESWSR